MSRRLLFVFGLILLSIPERSLAKGQEVPSRLRSQVDSAITMMKPALVRIQVVSAEYNEGREVKMQVVGSGAIITKEGYLIAKHHIARPRISAWNSLACGMQRGPSVW